jgi:hypothetical protein
MFPRVAGFAFSRRDHVADYLDARAKIVLMVAPNSRQEWLAGLSATPSIFAPPRSMSINTKSRNER